MKNPIQHFLSLLQNKSEALWKGRYVLFVLVGLLLFISAVIYFTRGKNNDAWDSIVSMDGRGYYAFLPALFIHNDPTFEFYRTYNPIKEPHVNFTHELDDGKRVNKYFIGEAVLLSPFFAVAHLYSKCFGLSTTGYEPAYFWSVSIAAVVYCCLGLWFLHLFLHRLLNRKAIALIVPLLLLFGSNAYYYAIYQPSMSHTYSFFLVSFFLFLSSHVKEKLHHVGWMLLLGVVMGLIAVVRPVNIVIVIGFLLVFNSFSEFFFGIFSKKNSLSISALVLGFCLLLALQLSIYKWQTGHWLYWSYKDEGFNFAKPEIANTLFSYTKGFFLYAPICFIALFGIPALAAVSKHKTVVLLATIALGIYLVSSWHAWGYGWAFGLRAYIEFIPLYGILLAFLLYREKPKYQNIFIGVAVLFSIVFTQIKTQQIVDRDLPLEGIDKELFWERFWW